MEAWDKRFMSHSTAVRTCPVAAGDIGATDFDLTKEQQDWLLNSGKTRGSRFPGRLQARGLRKHIREKTDADRRNRVR